MAQPTSGGSSDTQHVCQEVTSEYDRYDTSRKTRCQTLGSSCGLLLHTRSLSRKGEAMVGWLRYGCTTHHGKPITILSTIYAGAESLSHSGTIGLCLQVIICGNLWHVLTHKSMSLLFGNVIVAVLKQQAVFYEMELCLRFNIGACLRFVNWAEYSECSNLNRAILAIFYSDICC